MDILAGLLAYVAGIGALFAALAISFFVFFATPHKTLQTETRPQNATAMLVRPRTSNKPAEARAKPNATQNAGRFGKLADKPKAAAGSTVTAQAAVRDPSHKHAAAAAQARRLIQEERARRWAYQQDSSFERRFLGYAD